MRNIIGLVVLVVVLVTGYILVIKPPYQGRDCLWVSENIAKLPEGQWSSKGRNFIEVSQTELEAIGVDWKKELGKDSNDTIVVDSNIHDKKLYLLKDEYLKHRAKLESMRSTKWWR